MTEDSSFFSRFCCCSTSAKEEPPVQLITANSLPQQTQTQNLSKSEETADGFEDINLAEIKMDNKAKEVKENGKPVKPIEKEDFAMNDIMMNEILQNETLSNHEAILEDVISIESNVIEEAKEEEFQEYTKGETSGATSPSSSSEKGAELADKEAESDDVIDEAEESDEEEDEMIIEEAEPKKKEAELNEAETEPATTKEAVLDEEGTESEDDDVVEITSRSDEVVTFEQMMQEGYESTPNTARDSILSIPDAGREDVLAVLSARDEDIESEDEEGEVEIQTHTNDSKPIPSPRSSPPKPSLMYADVDSDDSDNESDEEKEVEVHEESAERKILEFPARTHQDTDLHKVHMVEVIATDSDISDSEDSDAPPPPPSTSPPHDEEILDNYPVGGRNLIDLTTPRTNLNGNEKENDGGAVLNGVTRLSVKSNGNTTLYTGSGIRVQLESNDVTDDEFSEKLI